MAKKYYPYVPWEDDPISPVEIDSDRIDPVDLIHYRLEAVAWLTEGIYGPYARVLRWLTARDNKKLIADTRVLCVVQPVES